MPRRNSARAFSLVELMVVIAVVMLIIAIVLPLVGKARESARLAVCSSNLHQMHMGYLGWVAANPGAKDFDQRIRPSRTSELWTYLGQLGDSLQCPNDARVAQRMPGNLNEAFVPPNGAGNIQIKGQPPRSLKLGKVENSKRIRMYKERSGLVLSRNVKVDVVNTGWAGAGKRSPGTIKAGTVVDVYLLHYDPNGKKGKLSGARVSFAGEVLGIINNRQRLINTDQLLGKPGTRYYTGKYRGMENDRITLEKDRGTITINSYNTPGFMEEVRVLVTPGTMTSYALNLDQNAGTALFSDYYGKTLFYIREELHDPYLQAYLDDPETSPGRHFGKINVVFEAGNVELVDPRDYFDRKSGFWDLSKRR